MSFFSTKRFLPLFLTQFLGAFNDNLFKNALVMLVTYRLAGSTGGNAQILVTMAAGLFILPFFLFSSLAGQLADKFERSQIVRIVKIAEILLMILASCGFIFENVYFLMTVLFCMGMHSTFFGPLKYALLPQHLQKEELLSGNAYIEAGTFLAILLGTILGGLLILHPQGKWLISGGLVAIAALGYATSRAVPYAPAHDPDLIIKKNIITETFRLVAYSTKDRNVFLCILGISWFWFIGATFLSQFPPYAKDVLHADETVVTLFLTVFSIGIGVGSFLCNKLLKGQIRATYVPIAALGISLFGADLSWASAYAVISPDHILTNVSFFLQQSAHWRILLDLFLLAVCGGVYIVPLYALLQHSSDIKHLARLIAANNVVNALFMVGSALSILAMIALSLSIPHIFLVVAAVNLVVAFYICKLLPEALFKSVMRAVLKVFYRVQIIGLENYEAAGKRVLIIANHTSFLDAALIAAYLPDKVTFAVNTHISNHWWFRPIRSLVNALPLDPTNPLAIKTLIDTLKEDKKCMIFPEGRITVTGSLMKIYEGPGMVADKSGAVLLPIHIEGAQYSPFSYLKGKVRIRLFPKIKLTVLPPHDFNLPQEVQGRKRRQLASAQLYDIMSEMTYESSSVRQTLFEALLDAKKIHGGKHFIAEDVERKPLSYASFITRSFILARVLKRFIRQEKTVGIMLPNSVTTALSFFALQALGRTPAMINFTSGSAQVLASCTLASVSGVITSRRFIEMGRLDAIVKTLAEHDIPVIYLEDVKKQTSFFDMLFGKLVSFFPQQAYHCSVKALPEQPAVILFTSGSEGTPKGVVLSHLNIQANRYQLASRIDFGPLDKVFNCLPMFHAFGLTGGTLLPMLAGIRTFFYPSPLHYRIVPELIYDTNATILFGTDTFLAGYARTAHPYDLHSLRYVFSGAERLKEETRKAFVDKFGVRVFEGYGATETAPILSINTPMQNRIGSVGRFMPGISYRLQPIRGIEEGGQLWVKGPNIMLGYLRAEKPGVLQPLEDQWYNTGDIVSMDADGYITIKGRTKRFAKIAGEMISLTVVESAATNLWPEHQHVAINVPDERKGEQIILLTTKPSPDRSEMTAHFKSLHLPDLAIPKTILTIDKIPLLGTGKTDYQQAKAVILEKMK